MIHVCFSSNDMQKLYTAAAKSGQMQDIVPAIEVWYII